MPKLIGWTIVSLLVLAGSYIRVEDGSLQNPDSVFPDAIVTFDWTGFLITVGIAAGVALVAWLILKRRK